MLAGLDTGVLVVCVAVARGRWRCRGGRGGVSWLAGGLRRREVGWLECLLVGKGCCGDHAAARGPQGRMGPVKLVLYSEARFSAQQLGQSVFARVARLLVSYTTLARRFDREGFCARITALQRATRRPGLIITAKSPTGPRAYSRAAPVHQKLRRASERASRREHERPNKSRPGQPQHRAAVSEPQNLIKCQRNKTLKRPRAAAAAAGSRGLGAD